MERRNIYPDGVVFRAYPDGEVQHAEGARASLITYLPDANPRTLVRLNTRERAVHAVSYLKARYFGKEN